MIATSKYSNTLYVSATGTASPPTKATATRDTAATSNCIMVAQYLLAIGGTSVAGSNYGHPDWVFPVKRDPKELAKKALKEARESRVVAAFGKKQSRWR